MERQSSFGFRKTRALLGPRTDPSLDKVSQTLGLASDEELLAALDFFLTRQEELTRLRRTKEQARNDRRRNKKALKVLGYDASREKARQLTGASECEFDSAQKERLQIEADCREAANVAIRLQRDARALHNRRENAKGFAVLGAEPSTDKAISQLGHDARLAQMSIWTPITERRRLRVSAWMFAVGAGTTLFTLACGFSVHKVYVCMLQR